MMKKFFLTGISALCILSLGCASRQSEVSEVDKKIEDLQKQLDEAKQELADATEKAEKAVEDANVSAQEASRNALAKTQEAKAASSALAKSKQAQSTAEKKIQSELAETRRQIAAADAKADEARRLAAAPKSHTLAAGTPIVIRTTNKLTTKDLASGSTFEASLEQPLVVDGYEIAQRGASVEGVVTNSDPGGRVKGVASITIGARRIVMADGRTLEIRTNSYSAQANKSKGKDAAKIGIASGIGAAIGAIAGGGKGAAIGAGAGAAGGTGVVLGTRGNAAEIGPETVLTLKLSSPVTVQELKR